MWRSVLVLLSVPWMVTAQSTARPIPQTQQPVRIDGRLDEEIWARALPVELGFETAPRANVVAPLGTRCLLARDDDHLYLGCVATDSSRGEIRAQYVDRDQIQAHDRISLYLDPFDDGQRAFVFEVSAVGVQADAVFDQARGNADLSWNALWTSGARITEEGYVVEASIPFRSLRFPKASTGRWRYFIQRSVPRSVDMLLRSVPRDYSNSCLLCDAAHLESTGQTPRLANLQLTPTLTATRSSQLSSSSGGLEPRPMLHDIGTDVHWGVTSEVAVSATINPDFSQVESDAVQLQVNNRFALFFPERRNFFLQDAELFSTPIRGVFTRSIADPVAGAKVTARSGRYAGGVLYARDAVTSLLIPGAFSSSSTVLDAESNVAAARISRAVGASSRVGVLATARQAEGYSSSMGGGDAFLRLARPLELQLQLLGSHTRYPDSVATQFSQDTAGLRGYAARAEVRYTTRDWTVRSLAGAISDGFRADVGFVTEVDSRRIEGNITRRFWARDPTWITRLDGSLGTWHVKTLSGLLKEEGVWTSWEYLGPWQSRFAINPFVMREQFAGVTYPRAGFNVSSSVRPNASFGVSTYLFAGGRVDYANERYATERQLEFSTDFRVGRHMTVDASGSEIRLSTGGARIVRERIAKTLFVYGWSPRTQVRALAQLRSTRSDPSMNRAPVDERALRLESQLIVSYRLNGQSAAFLGYSSLARDARQDQLPLHIARQSQTLFMKLAYAWRP